MPCRGGQWLRVRESRSKLRKTRSSSKGSPPKRIGAVERRCPGALFAGVQSLILDPLGIFEIVQNALPHFRGEGPHSVNLLHGCDRLVPLFSCHMVRGDKCGGMARNAIGGHKFAARTWFEAGRWGGISPGSTSKQVRLLQHACSEEHEGGAADEQRCFHEILTAILCMALLRYPLGFQPGTIIGCIWPCASVARAQTS